MSRTTIVLLIVALVACVPKPKPMEPRPLELTGISMDGTGIDTSTLKGKPWVIDLWRVA
jgi:hypothetical protein